MLSIAALGAVCELEDNAVLSIVRDHLLLTPEEAEAELEADRALKRKETRRRGWRWSGLSDVIDAPWYARPRHHRKSISLRFTEFADLSDGRRFTIRNDRGFGWSWKRKRDAWYGTTRTSLAEDVRDNFRQYEEDRPTTPEWVSERLWRLYEVDVDLASVEAALRAPRQVELGPRLLEALPE